jgi:hypothetical protein
MNHHEREFFISLIRSGKIIINYNDVKLEIISPTIEQSLEANLIYNQAFENTYIDGIMTEYEIQEWMNDNGLWTIQEEKKTKSLKDDLERLKIEIYNNRYEKKNREQIRKYIRACEKYTAEHLREKNSFYQNTRESYALLEKLTWILKNTTYCDGKLYDFKDISLSYVIEEWQNAILSESNIRELSREEPWKSLWSIRENTRIKLFCNNDNQELTTNQKHLVVWSQIYDNIQESLDCPEEEFIKDDDVLDGWFFAQARKRKAEKLEREIEGELKNEKIRNSKEVFVVTKDKDNQRRIEDMNDPIAKAIKRQRQELIMSQKTVNQIDLPDEKLELQLQINNMRK